MKNIFYLVILVFLTSCGTSFVAKHGQLSVKGTQLVDKNQQQIILRGMSFGGLDFIINLQFLGLKKILRLM